MVSVELLNSERRVADELRAEIERLTADKAAISQTASDYLHEIERLRAALRDAHGLIDNYLVGPWIMAHKLDDVLLDGEKR